MNCVAKCDTARKWQCQDWNSGLSHTQAYATSSALCSLWAGRRVACAGHLQGLHPSLTPSRPHSDGTLPCGCSHRSNGESCSTGDSAVALPLQVSLLSQTGKRAVPGSPGSTGHTSAGISWWLWHNEHSAKKETQHGVEDNGSVKRASGAQDFNLFSTIPWWCDPGEVTRCLWASFSPSEKWKGLDNCQHSQLNTSVI